MEAIEEGPEAPSQAPSANSSYREDFDDKEDKVSRHLQSELSALYYDYDLLDGASQSLQPPFHEDIHDVKNEISNEFQIATSSPHFREVRQEDSSQASSHRPPFSEDGHDTDKKTISKEFQPEKPSLYRIDVWGDGPSQALSLQSSLYDKNHNEQNDFCKDSQSEPSSTVKYRDSREKLLQAPHSSIREVVDDTQNGLLEKIKNGSSSEYSTHARQDGNPQSQYRTHEVHHTKAGVSEDTPNASTSTYSQDGRRDRSSQGPSLRSSFGGDVHDSVYERSMEVQTKSPSNSFNDDGSSQAPTPRSSYVEDTHEAISEDSMGPPSRSASSNHAKLEQSVDERNGSLACMDNGRNTGCARVVNLEGLSTYTDRKRITQEGAVVNMENGILDWHRESSVNGTGAGETQELEEATDSLQESDVFAMPSSPPIYVNHFAKFFNLATSGGSVNAFSKTQECQVPSSSVKSKEEAPAWVTVIKDGKDARKATKQKELERLAREKESEFS